MATNDTAQNESKDRSPATKYMATSNMEKTQVKMPKSLGVTGGVAMIMGVMIGSGIFISPAGVLYGAGSVGLSLILWLIGGLVSLCGALVYAELGTLIPRSSGGYAYLLEATHPVVAFLFVWTSAVVLQPSGVAVISLTCAQYILTPLFDDGCEDPPTFITKALTIGIILLLTAINCLSTQGANKVQVFFTAAKLLALAIIITGGIAWLGQGYTEYISTGFENTNTNIGEIAIAFYASMWAFEGWVVLNLVTEELENPSRNLPLCICLAVPAVTVLYLLTNVSYFTVLSTEEILQSSAVAVSWAGVVIPEVAWIMPIFVAMSTFGAANGSLFGSARVLHVAGREGQLTKAFSMIHINRYTPVPAVLITGILAALMVIPLGLGELLNIFSFASWLFNAITFACHIHLRRVRPDAHRPFKCPVLVSVLCVLVSIFLVLAPLIMAPQVEFLYALLFILAGSLLYFPFVHNRRTLPGMEAVNIFLQLCFKIAPSDEYSNDKDRNSVK